MVLFLMLFLDLKDVGYQELSAGEVAGKENEEDGFRIYYSYVYTVSPNLIICLSNWNLINY